MNSIISVFLFFSAIISASFAQLCNISPTQLVLSASSSGYVFSGVSNTNPALTLVIGQYYTFIASPVQSSDPFFIKTSRVGGVSNLYTTGITGNGQLVISWTVDASLLGQTLYYVSGGNNGVAASGTINFVSPSTCSTSSPLPTSYVSTSVPTTGSTTVAPTTSGVPTNAPAYLSVPVACYSDSNSYRILSTKVISDSTGFTRQRCADAAYAGSYTYYGLEYGAECWVGNSLNLTSAMVLNATTSPTNLCNMVCSGATNQLCGGYFASDLNMIVKPPVLTLPSSTGGVFSAWSGYPFNTTLSISSTQAGLALPQRDLLPVYSPFPTASQTTMALLYLNCPTQACLTASQTVYLCIDAESCNQVGLAGYFTLPIVGNSASTIFNKVRLLGANGAYGDYFISVVRYTAPTVTPTPYVPTSAPSCYVDTVASRVLPNLLYNGPANSVDTCRTRAAAAGYSYFGVEYGVECYGANALVSPVASAACNYACSGNSSQICGGSFAVTVYSIPSSPLAPGCYVDSATNRLLKNKIGTSASNTIDSCKALAVAASYSYYGVQYGTECWADNTYASSVPSNACTYVCPGNSNQICGGLYAVNVYNLFTPTSAATGTTTTVATTVATTVTATVASGSGTAACNTASNFVLSQSSTNSNAFSFLNLGDNPTLTLATQKLYTFQNTINTASPLYISTSPSYSVANIVSSSNAQISNPGAPVTLVTFTQPGTYYYTSQFNANMYGTINVQAVSCP